MTTKYDINDYGIRELFDYAKDVVQDVPLYCERFDFAVSTNELDIYFKIVDISERTPNLEPFFETVRNCSGRRTSVGLFIICEVSGIVEDIIRLSNLLEEYGVVAIFYCYVRKQHFAAVNNQLVGIKNG